MLSDSIANTSLEDVFFCLKCRLLVLNKQKCGTNPFIRHSENICPISFVDISKDVFAQTRTDCLNLAGARITLNEVQGKLSEMGRITEKNAHEVTEKIQQLLHVFVPPPPFNQNNAVKRQTRSTSTLSRPRISLKRIDSEEQDSSQAKNTQPIDFLCNTTVTNEPFKTKALLKQYSKEIIGKNVEQGFQNATIVNNSEVAGPQSSPKIETIITNTNSPVGFVQDSPGAANQADQKRGSKDDANLISCQTIETDRPADFVQDLHARGKAS